MSHSKGIALLLLLLVPCLVLRGADAQAEQETPSGYAMNGQCASPIGMDLPNAYALTGLSSSVPASFYEDFEGAWPKPGWAFVDNMAYSDYWLGARACYPMEGQHSGWLHGGGRSGSALACGSWYPSSLETWSRYGPFDLTEAASSSLTFYLFGDSEYDGDGDCTDDDFMFLLASTDPERDYRGMVYCGAWLSGDQANDYYRLSFDLADYVGQSEVYFAFGMVTDYGTNARGYHIDNLELATTWRTPTPTTTPSPTTEGTLTPTPTASNTPMPTATPTVSGGLLLEPVFVDLDVGQDAWIDIHIVTAAHSVGVEVELTYDPAVIEILPVSGMPFERGNWLRLGTVAQNAFVGADRIHYHVTDDSSLSGSGTVARFHIRALGLGSSSLRFTQAAVTEWGGGQAQTRSETGTVYVNPSITPTPTSLPRLDLLPDASQLVVGGEAWVDLWITDAVHLAGALFDVGYNDSVVDVLPNNYLPFVPGEFFIGALWHNVFGDSGTLEGWVQMPSGPSSGSGSIARFKVRGVAEGVCDLTFLSSTLIGEVYNPQTVPHMVGHASIVVTSADQGASHQLALPLVRRDNTPTAMATIPPEPTGTHTVLPTIPHTPTDTPTQTPTWTCTASPTATTTPTEMVWSK